MPFYTYECSQCGNCDEQLMSYPPPDQLWCGECDGLAHRRFPVPSLVTDTSFLASHGTLLQQCEGDDKEADRIAKAAKKQGYTPGINDVYVPTIATSTGDPAAFITPGDGRGHVKDVCRSRGMSCNGRVEYTAPERPPVQKKKLSEKFIRERSRALVHQRPELAHKPAGELRQQLIAKHALNKG